MNNGNNKRNMIIGIVIVVVIVIIIAIVAFGNHAAPTQTSTTTQNGAAAPAAPAPSYTSSADSFGVNFPGTPDVTNTTFDSPTAGAIPVTEYKESAAGGTSNAYDVVFVYHYPSSYTFSASYLSGALTEFASLVTAKYPGSKIASQTPTQLRGQAALQATITIPNAGDMYVVITTKGQNGYLVGTYGLSQSDYNSFAGSFAFTQ